MRNRLSDPSGLCLTELMIGMAAALLILAASLEVLYLGQKAVGAGSRKIAQQQDRRLGLEVFEQEVRLATPESLLVIGRDTVEFSANVHARHTNITAPVEQGQTALPVLDGRNWERGKFVKLCAERRCETHRLARDGQRSQLFLESPVSGSYSIGASVEMRNRVTYYTRTGGPIRLMRMVDGGAGALIADLKAVRFFYRDQRGLATNDPSAVARVIIEIEPADSSRVERRTVALRS